MQCAGRLEIRRRLLSVLGSHSDPACQHARDAARTPAWHPAAPLAGRFASDPALVRQGVERRERSRRSGAKSNAAREGRDRKELDGDECRELMSQKRCATSVTVGRRARPKSRETVRSDTSTPTLASSPWIRGAPPSGFAAAVWRKRFQMAAAVHGSPAPR